MFLIPASDPALSHSQETRPEDTARGALRQRRKAGMLPGAFGILKPFESPSDKFIFEGENKFTGQRVLRQAEYPVPIPPSTAPTR